MRTIPLLLLFVTVAFPASPLYTVEPFAGSDWVGDGGPSRDSLLFQAEGLAADRDGNLFISDAQTHRVRRIDPAGIITTIAGTGISGLSGDDGPATRAQLSAPYGLATDANGNLFIADLGNHRIRRIARDGTISTLATGFLTPRNLTVDLPGNLYISDFDANRVYQLTPSGAISTIAGPDQVDHPAGLAVDRGGVLYIGDTGHHAVWKYQAGAFTKIATAYAPTGLALDAMGRLTIADPGGAATVIAHDLAISSNGTLYTTDGRLIRRVQSGITTVIAGRGDPARGDNGPALDSRLNNPAGLALDTQGNLFISDSGNHRIRRIDSKGIITTYAGSGLAGNSGDGGAALAADLSSPTTLRSDASGNLYINDSGNHRIRMVNTAGILLPAKALPDAPDPTFLIDATQRLVRRDANGATSILDLSRPIVLPTAVIAADDGTLYVADADQDRVWRLTPAPIPPDPVSLLRIPNRMAPGMIAMFEGYSFTQPEVVFDNIIATILSRTETSLAVLVPTQVQAGPVEVDIRERGQTLTRLTGTIVGAAPQVFAVVDQDGSVNSAEAPATRGSVLVIYGTGQGTLPQQTVDVRIGGYSADVLYSGSVLGYPGLWQVNARIPGGFLTPGLLPVTVSVGDAISTSLAVTIN